MLAFHVDGVLNPFARRASAPPAGFERYEQADMPLLLSRRHGAWLRTLTDDFELVWAWSWEDDANRLVAPRIGLPKLPVIHFDDDDGWTVKVPDVIAYVGQRPCAWIDDDLHSPIRALVCLERKRGSDRVD